MEVKIIVGYNKHRVIGVDGDLPWRIPEDLKHFKRLTTGHVCAMGRKTWESIPEKYRPLPDRVNMILTRNVGAFYEQNPDLIGLDNVYVTSLLMEALLITEFQHEDKDLFITGGEEIFRLALEEGIVDEIIASEIKGYDDINEGAKFPELDKFWKRTLIESFDDFDVCSYR